MHLLPHYQLQVCTILLITTFQFNSFVQQAKNPFGGYKAWKTFKFSLMDTCMLLLSRLQVTLGLFGLVHGPSHLVTMSATCPL